MLRFNLVKCYIGFFYTFFFSQLHQLLKFSKPFIQLFDGKEKSIKNYSNQ